MAINTALLEQIRSMNATSSSTAIVAYGAPTLERLQKDADWERKAQPGGQVSHAARSTMATYAKHFTEDEIGYGRQLIEDADLATRVNLTCGRVYSGAPRVGAGDLVGHLTDRERLAHQRFHWVIASLDEKFKAAVAFLVLGVRSERMGRTMSAEEFATMGSRYQEKETRRAFSVGFMKAALIRIGEAYRAWDLQRART